MNPHPQPFPRRGKGARLLLSRRAGLGMTMLYLVQESEAETDAARKSYGRLLLILLGVDVLIGVDPKEYDLRRCAELSAGKLCLWGGVNGHLTVERGDPDQVAREVAGSLEILGNQPGFILQ